MREGWELKEYGVWENKDLGLSLSVQTDLLFKGFFLLRIKKI